MSDEVDKELLDLLDNAIAPKGKFSDKAFEHFYTKFAEDYLMNIGEPSEDDEDEYAAWEESTLKHKIFDYAPLRPAKLGKFPSGKNDLSYVLAYACVYNEELLEELTKELEKY